MSQHSRNVSRDDLPIVDVFEFEGRMVTFHCADLRKAILGAKLLTKHSLPLNGNTQQERVPTNDGEAAEMAQ